MNTRNLVITAALCTMVFGLWVSETHANVILKALVVNPSKTKTQNAVLKAYLPKEVKPEDIVEMEDLKIDYDVDKEMYYVYQVYDLKPGQSVAKQVSINDIWLIEEERLTLLNAKAQDLARELQNTSYKEQAIKMQEGILAKTQDIITRQNQNRDALPQAHIAAYRDNMELLNQISSTLDDLDKMVFETQTASGVVVEKVSVRASWWVILGVIIALGILSLIFFIIWHGQAVKQKEGEEGEEGAPFEGP